MMPPTKTQEDIGKDEPKLDASDGALILDGIAEGESDENKDMARQEYKQEADINYMLSRFGVTQPRGTPTYGEVDDTLDLQTAIHAVREAREGFKTLPADLREKFGTMENFLRAVDNGSLVINTKEEPKPSSASDGKPSDVPPA